MATMDDKFTRLIILIVVAAWIAWISIAVLYCALTGQGDHLLEVLWDGVGPLLCGYIIYEIISRARR